MVHEFCIKNKLDPPLLDFQARLKYPVLGQYRRAKNDSLYLPEILVDARRCLDPTESLEPTHWPGHLADFSCLGTTAHELGHHVCHLRDWVRISRAWYSVTMGAMDEPAVGLYATYQTAEDFAETLRVFILNPSLVEELAPKRNRFLVKEMLLKPVESRHWRELLSDSPRHIKEVEKRL